jgi:integrase
VLDPAEARALLYNIDVSTHAGLRHRALLGLMVYSFARIGAALGMVVEGVYRQNRRLWVRLREKGGKRHAMRCHHNLEEYLTAYLDGARLRDDPKGPLFPTIGRGHRHAHPHGAAASERLCDDPPARRSGRDRNQARQSQFLGHRDHRIFEDCRHP